MRMVAIFAGLVGLALTACGAPEPAGGAVPPPSNVTTAPSSATTPAPLVDVGGRLYEAGSAPLVGLLGLPLDEFEALVAELGFGPVRIAWQDGMYLDLEDDLRQGRVNVAVERRDGSDVVIDAFVEFDPETGTSEPEATIVDVFEGVQFYPACGNESLTHDGAVWYQVQESEYPEIYDRAVNGYRENIPETVTVRGFAPRVVAPGPGDDVGTVVVWSDGVAYFVSDSGDLSAWLVQDELSYPWEC